MVSDLSAGETGLSPFVLDNLKKTFARFPEIEKVMLFGSRATGHHRPGSDIDLAVFAPKLSDQAFSRLAGEVDELPIAFSMDIVHFDTLENPALKKQILSQGKTLYINRPDG